MQHVFKYFEGLSDIDIDIDILLASSLEHIALNDFYTFFYYFLSITLYVHLSFECPSNTIVSSVIFKLSPGHVFIPKTFLSFSTSYYPPLPSIPQLLQHGHVIRKKIRKTW